MPVKTCALALLALLLAGPSRAEPEADPLAEAQLLYERGAAALVEGDAERGRELLGRALSTLGGSVSDARLAAELRGDVAAMIEKIRAWEPPEPGAEVGELDAPAELLAAEPAAAVRGAASASAVELDPNDETARKYIHLYTGKRKRSVEEALGRSGRYRPMMEAALLEAGLPRELFWLVMAESEFKPLARSHAGAAGLWQFMPFTARKYGLEVSFWVDERYDPEKATRAAARYLRDLHQWFGDWHLALAAYNRGENGLGRDLAATRATDFATTSRRGAMPLETRHYVPKFMACAFIGQDPKKYGLEPRYESPEAYDELELPRDLSLEVAAKAAGADLETIQRLNPAIRNWATPPKRPGFRLRVPAGSKDSVLAALAATPEWNPGPSLLRYRVSRGDVLGAIAKRHRTTVKAIMELNGLRSAKRLRPGMILKLKPGRGFAAR